MLVENDQGKRKCWADQQKFLVVDGQEESKYSGGQ